MNEMLKQSLIGLFWLPRIDFCCKTVAQMLLRRAVLRYAPAAPMILIVL